MRVVGLREAISQLILLNSFIWAWGLCEIIYNFDSVEKNDLCFHSQEHMSITDSQYLQSYVGTCVRVND